MLPQVWPPHALTTPLRLPPANLQTENDQINRNIIERRSNFLGLQLKAVTEEQGNDLILDSRYKKDAPYFANNDTYLVNGYTSGKCSRLKCENGFQFSTMVEFGMGLAMNTNENICF